MKIRELVKSIPLASWPLNLESSMNEKDMWLLIGISCFSLAIPYLWMVIPGYLVYKTNRKKSNPGTREPLLHDIEQIVSFIQSNRLQSLTESIESNPDLLYGLYKKQSLLYWCKYHNNTKALMVVVQLLKKHPKERLPLAA